MCVHVFAVHECVCTCACMYVYISVCYVYVYATSWTVINLSGYKCVFVLSMQVGVNLSAYINYGFLATTTLDY